MLQPKYNRSEKAWQSTSPNTDRIISNSYLPGNAGRIDAWLTAIMKLDSAEALLNLATELALPLPSTTDRNPDFRTLAAIDAILFEISNRYAPAARVRGSGPLLTVQSMAPIEKGGPRWYDVNLEQETCTCLDSQSDRCPPAGCKHLRAGRLLVAYRTAHRQHAPRPSFVFAGAEL